MKKILSILLILSAFVAAVALSACKSTPPATINAIAAASQIAVKDGTYLYTSAHPETRAQFAVAANTLRTLAAQTNLNFTAALAVLQELPIKEVQDPVVHILVSDADVILTYLNVNIPLTDVEHLRPIVTALAQGIEDGLAMPPVKEVGRHVRVVGRNGDELSN